MAGMPTAQPRRRPRLPKCYWTRRSAMLVGGSLFSVVLMAACGSTSANQGGASTSSSSRATLPGKTVRADHAAAAAANLTLSDFPNGWTAQAQSSSSDGPKGLKATTAKCLGASVSDLGPNNGTDVSSPNFTGPSGNESISSSVAFAGTTAAAHRIEAVWSSPKIPGCLTTALRTAISYELAHPTGSADSTPKGMTIGAATVSQLSFAHFGDRSIAYRASIPVQYDGLSLDVDSDLVVIESNQALVQMSFQDEGSPVSSSDEEYYTGLVIGRLPNGGGSSTGSTPPGSGTTSTTQPPNGKPLGTKISFPPDTSGAVNVSVLTYSQPVTPSDQFTTPSAGDVFAVITVQDCAGPGGEPSGPDTTSFTLVLADGSQLQSDSQDATTPSLDSINALSPGQCGEGSVTFDVPQGQRPVSIEYTASSSSSSSATVARWAVPAS